jgi:hypothetical protein
VKVARALIAATTLAPWSKAMRAQRWFDAKQLATASKVSTAAPGDNLASMEVRWLLCLLLFALAVLACDYPDEGTMLPEAEARAAQRRRCRRTPTQPERKLAGES